MSFNAGKPGAYLSAKLPSGLAKPRNSPARDNLKLVCRGRRGSAILFPDACTSRNSPGGMLTSGNVHFSGLSSSSLRPHPSRFAGSLPGLCSSIQSEVSPKLSFSVLSLAATISLMNGSLATPVIARPSAKKPVSNVMGDFSRISNSKLCLPPRACGNLPCLGKWQKLNIMRPDRPD